MRIGADFKDMDISDIDADEYVEINMNIRRGWIQIDKEDAEAIIKHLTEQFKLEGKS